MKNISLIFLITTLPHLITANTIELNVSGSQQRQMPITIMIPRKNKELEKVAAIISKDLQFTEQFNPTIEKYKADLPTKDIGKKIKNLANAGIPLALYLSAHNANCIEWQLYDTTQCTMLQGKKYHKKGSSERGWAHTIADGTWKTLTGHDGFFSSRLAYCKDAKNAVGNTKRTLYIADFDGSNEQAIVNATNIIVAPRWDTTRPCIFYSEYTDTKVCLMSHSLKEKRSKNISRFDEGIEMHRSTHPNKNENYIYCASQGRGSAQIYYCKNNKHKPCTQNSGNNLSPIFLDEHRICFCSDFQTGNPQIYIGNLQSGHLQRISKGGYCTSPNYCPKTNKIVYHKMIQGTMQIMLYDCASKNHTQLTADRGNKHEACLSPDGTHMLYNHEDNNKSRLAMRNLLTNNTKYLGDPHDHYSYPHWSPCCYTKYLTT